MTQPRSEPVFQVRVMKHIGLLVACFNQSYTFTGSYAQCQEELRKAQRQNQAFGWWSIASVLMWNWIALAGNASTRKSLARQAAQMFGHPSTGGSAWQAQSQQDDGDHWERTLDQRCSHLVA